MGSFDRKFRKKTIFCTVDTATGLFWLGYRDKTVSLFPMKRQSDKVIIEYRN